MLNYGWRTAWFDFWEVALVVRGWPEIHADTKTGLHADCTDDVLEENMVKGSIILALLCPQFPKFPYGYFANKWSDPFWFLLWRECASRRSLNICHPTSSLSTWTWWKQFEWEVRPTVRAMMALTGIFWYVNCLHASSKPHLDPHFEPSQIMQLIELCAFQSMPHSN